MSKVMVTGEICSHADICSATPQPSAVPIGHHTPPRRGVPVAQARIYRADIQSVESRRNGGCQLSPSPSLPPFHESDKGLSALPRGEVPWPPGACSELRERWTRRSPSGEGLQDTARSIPVPREYDRQDAQPPPTSDRMLP